MIEDVDEVGRMLVGNGSTLCNSQGRFFIFHSRSRIFAFAILKLFLLSLASTSDFRLGRG